MIRPNSRRSRTMLGADDTVAGPPYAPLIVPGFDLEASNTIAPGSSAGAPFMLTFTPKSPARALALYLNRWMPICGAEIAAIYIGAQGANAGQNLLGQNGQAVGYIPYQAFISLDACVPLLDLGVGSYSCPFIVVGRTVADLPEAFDPAKFRASLIVEYV